MSLARISCVLLFVAGCSRSGGPRAATRSSPVAEANVLASANAALDAGAATERASVHEEAAAASKGVGEQVDRINRLLSPPNGDERAAARCTRGGRSERIECLLSARYAADPKARDVALSLYRGTGSVAGVEVEQQFNGGYRGILHLVPVLPVDRERVHLERVATALSSFERFFRAFEGDGGASRYRFRDLELRFFRSVGARTPSAYAIDWTIAYNVQGSLNTTDDSVRETMFHEIFHLNDAAHKTNGSSDWSSRALGPIYDSIVKRCGAKTACLDPFAPNSTKVRGGTYYAFQPGNDVREYAAELAVRYYREQRGRLGQGPPIEPRFRCAKPENGLAWKALGTEFFGDVDLVPACGSP